jgi:uncharacterized protein (DUF305 family)
VIVFAVGLIFLVVWAIKHLNAGQLKNWGIGLLIAGTLACLLTIGVKGSPWMGNGIDGPGMGMMRMGMMGRDTDDMGSMMENMMENGMGMSMMLRGKTGDDFDRAFIQMMIPHHQDAINMANMALKDAKHDEMKNLARDIISAQQREIDMMKEWQRSWGYSQ